MIIIAGITRSGLTATMQMLNAGGFPCLGKYPAFEPFTFGNVNWALAKNSAVKLVDAQLQIPTKVKDEYKIIRLSRDFKQQAKSINKFAGVFGIPEMKIRDIVKSVKKDYKKIDKWAAEHSTLSLKFENLIDNPKDTAQTISNFIGFQLDIEKAAGIIRKRTSKCHEKLLELDMIKGEL